MFLQNEKYLIEIKLDEMYTINSADNPFSYDKILYARNILPSEHYKTLSLQINNGAYIFKIALIGDYFSYDFDCAVLNDDILTVMQNQNLTSIRLSDLEIVNKVELPSYGINYGIYRCKCGYLIYGEIKIILLDFDFNVCWDFSGIDIFVTRNGNKPFDFTDDKIILHDWENNCYELDYNGILLQ